jgi:hypothetical protein
MSEIPEYNDKILFIVDGMEWSYKWDELKEKCVFIYEDGGRMNITTKDNIKNEFYMKYNFGKDYKKKDIIIKDINVYDVYNSDSIVLMYYDDDHPARKWWKYMLQNNKE